jgi:probable nitrogen fixation protein
MSTETNPIFEADFIREMVRQMRAVDTYGIYNGWSAEKILDPFVLTKEKKAEIPLVGAPDEETISHVKCLYNAISVLIEKECKLIGRAAGASDPRRLWPRPDYRRQTGGD